MPQFRCAQCAGEVGPRTLVCPHCGAPTGIGMTAQVPRGFTYRSAATCCGLPLVHIAVGPQPDAPGFRGIARGIIAIGDIACGVVAVGGVAVGGLAIGGLALGVLALGGGAIALLAAVGGLAVAGFLAVGGLAVGYWAVGGGAFGAHVMSGIRQDPAAVEWFRQHLPFLLPPNV